MPPRAAGWLVLGGALAVSCAGPAREVAAVGSPSAVIAPGQLVGHHGELPGATDPTVPGGRLFPESLGDAHVWGAEPGGGERAIVAGVRIVSSPDGALAVADQRLPASPSSVVALPERLGGGFLYALRTVLWRSPNWLGPATPIYTSPVAIGALLVGLDRVYVRSPQGAIGALDPRTGAPLDLGPLPGSPDVSRFAALDAWRAVAIADLRGALVTLDAGSSWQKLALPIEPTDVAVADGAFLVTGQDGARQPQFWEVRPDGQAGRLGAAPAATAAVNRLPAPPGAATKPFGPRPLLSALEDGWPLADGTALVARDGALARVRLADGALIESAAGAFPLAPARCHPLSLATPRAPGAFGFVCGEPRGRTRVYRWDAAGARMIELRAFDGPREVLAFGNGALAVRGPCASDASGDAGAAGQAWCTMRPRPGGDPWSEMILKGSDVDRARVVVLADGSAAVLRPPDAGQLPTASLTIVDGARATHTPLETSALRPEVVRVLRLGVWLDGFEERRPGVLGGWVDAAGTVVGVEVALDGAVRAGELIRDAGAPVVSGRWGLGWTASRRGFETTDGGMTWAKDLVLPEPIAAPRDVRERACGPVGCIVAGWLRVGWGAAKASPLPDPPAAAGVPPLRGPAPLRLSCEALAGEPPERVARAPIPPLLRPFVAPGLRATGGLQGRLTLAPSAGAVAVFPPFSGRPGPAIAADDVGLSVESSNAVERAIRGMPVARVYGWGPKWGDWDSGGRWEARWQWPWGGWTDARTTSSAPAPWSTLETARHWLGIDAGGAVVWTLASGDDAEHALLIGRRTTGGSGAQIVSLEVGRPPIEVPANDRLTDVEGAVRIAGRWYVASPHAPSELPATVVWSLDGGGLREVARVPRVGGAGRTAARLARGVDGRALGIAVEGRSDLNQRPALWVTSIDLETGAVSEPRSLAPVDLAGRAVSLCTGDDAGWELDLPYPGTVEAEIGAGWKATLASPAARMRLSRDGACAVRLLGAVDGFGSVAPSALFSATRARTPASREAGDGPRTIDVTVLAARTRFPLRCSAR